VHSNVSSSSSSSSSSLCNVHCDVQPPIETRDAEHKYLEPPERDKQFLISPPASPPVGWEVIGEREPAINYDLINAIARMGPGM